MRPLPLLPLLRAGAAATKWVGWLRHHGEGWRAVVEAPGRDEAWAALLALLALPSPRNGHSERRVLPEGVVPKPPRKRKKRPT